MSLGCCCFVVFFFVCFDRCCGVGFHSRTPARAPDGLRDGLRGVKDGLSDTALSAFNVTSVRF